MTVVTNHHESPLGLPRGPVIEPGRSVKVDNWHVLRNHVVVKAWLAAEVISVEDGEEEPVHQDDGASLPAADVLAMAEDGTPFMSFKSAAAKLLGDAIPAKKAEIIAALEELATNPSA